MMMKTQRRSLLLMFCLLGAAAASTCPPVDAPCVNEDNHEKCQALLENGCTNLLWIESCPLHFACADRKSNLRTTAVPPKAEPDACVTLYVYDDVKCTGEPRRTMTFPTWSKPGSRCYHDVSLGPYSVKDQYCNLDTGNWHETVYMASTDCTTKWWAPRDGFDVTFTTDGCNSGFSLAECHLGPCSSQRQSHDAVDAKDFFFERPVAVKTVPTEKGAPRQRLAGTNKE